MKWLLRFVPLFALGWAGCSASNTPVVNNNIVDTTGPAAPTISKFSPDTVWTFGILTIYGTHFGFGSDVSVAIDTTQVQVSSASANDTIITVLVPEAAQTGPIRVNTINGTTTSTKPVVVQSTFHPHTINDSVTIGASFSIPGTGMNHSHGQLRLTVAAVPYPIDSIFANRIVSHVVANGFSGSITFNDSSGGYNGGTLIVTRPSSWNTLSQIWDHVSVTETHTRTGYVNGPQNPIDSTWKTTAFYLGQHDVNVSGVPFAREATGVNYTIAEPYILIEWDTITQTAVVVYQPRSSSMTPTHTVDTQWNSTPNLPALLPVDNAIEFTFPNFYYQINEDSTDTQGLVNWQETTTTTFVSGSFDLILKP